MIDFANLYDKNIDQLFAFGSRFTTDREMLKDCIHDVFLKFYTRRQSLDSVENIESYLYISLRNRINDEFRRNMHVCDNEITDTTMRARAEMEEYNHEQLERKYDDICRIMGINYQSVRNLMHRSISRLREFATQMAV